MTVSGNSVRLESATRSAKPGDEQQAERPTSSCGDSKAVQNRGSISRVVNMMEVKMLATCGFSSCTATTIATAVPEVEKKNKKKHQFVKHFTQNDENNKTHPYLFRVALRQHRRHRLFFFLFCELPLFLSLERRTEKQHQRRNRNKTKNLKKTRGRTEKNYQIPGAVVE